MQTTSSKKPILIIIVIILIAAGVFFYMSGTPKDESGLLANPVAGNTDAVGLRVLKLLNEIKPLNIDAQFFQTPAYSSLVDHTVPIYEQNIGKRNPFSNSNPRPATPAPSR